MSIACQLPLTAIRLRYYVVNVSAYYANGQQPGTSECRGARALAIFSLHYPLLSSASSLAYSFYLFFTAILIYRFLTFFMFFLQFFSIICCYLFFRFSGASAKSTCSQSLVAAACIVVCSNCFTLISLLSAVFHTIPLGCFYCAPTHSSLLFCTFIKVINICYAKVLLALQFSTPAYHQQVCYIGSPAH